MIVVDVFKRHTNVSPMDPVELCSTLTSSTNKPSSMVNYGDQFGLTPLHVAARRGAGVCCLHLIKVFRLDTDLPVWCCTEAVLVKTNYDYCQLYTFTKIQLSC